MTALDRLKPLAAGILAVAISLQIWYEFMAFGKEPVTFQYVLRFAAIGLAAAALATYGRSFIINAALRSLIAADFAYSIADRFGALGPYHTVGVSWGNWKNFVYYTHVLNGFLPAALAPYLAALATLLEATLAICLALGLLPRLATLATAVLLVMYVTTMTATSGFVSQLDFAVLLLASAAFFLACSASGAKTAVRRRLPGPGGI
jgi:uncharacterized membrane protein YphA (DoxX/SURF4 family)